MSSARLTERQTWLVVHWFVAVGAVGLQPPDPLLSSLETELGAAPSLLGLVASPGTVGFVPVRVAL